MSISSISGSQGAALFTALNTTGVDSALASVASFSGNGELIANLDLASSGVSSALQAISSGLGSIINTSA